MAQIKLVINPDTSKIDGAVKEIKNKFGELGDIKIKIDSGSANGLRDTAKAANQAGEAVGKFAKQVSTYAGEEERASTVVTRYNTGLGKSIERTEKLDKATGKYTVTLRRETDDREKAAKAIEAQQKAAERQMKAAERQATAVERAHKRESDAIQRATKQAVSLDTQFNNLSRSIKNLSKQYPEGTFDSVTSGITKVKSSLNLLNEMWANGDITAAEYRLGIQNLSGVYSRLTNDVSRTRAETQKLDKVTESLWMNIQKFARWYIMGNVFTKIIRSFTDALNVMKEVDSELANIQKVTDRTDTEMQSLAKSAYSVASSYGVAATDYLESVSTFAKAGYDELSESLAELATKTQLVGDVTSEIANQFLISVDAAWKMNGNVSMLSKTLDEANSIENNYATSIQKLAEGMPIVASVAANAGMSVEETMAAIGTISAVTQETGTKSATAFRALILNLIGAAGEYEDGLEVTEESISSLNDALNIYAKDAMEAAKAAGTVINPMTAIAALAEASESGTLNQAKLFELLSSLGGKLRTNQLTALVTNFEMFNEQLQLVRESAGSADKEIDIMLGTWDAKTKILKNTWTEFISKTVSSGLAKSFIDATTSVVDFADSLGLVLTTMVGLVTIFRGAEITKGFSKLKDAFANIPSLFKSGATWMQRFSAATTAIGAVTTAVSIGIMAYRQYREHLQKTAESTLDEAEKVNLANESLYDSYTALHNATEGTDEFKSSVEMLAKALGIDLSDGIDTAIGKIEELTAAELENAAISANTAMEKAGKSLAGNAHYFSWSGSVKNSGGISTTPELDTQIRSILGEVAKYNPENLIYSPLSKSADGIAAYYEGLVKVKELLEKEAYSSGDSSFLNSKIYKEVSKAIDGMSDSYNTFVSAVKTKDLAEARKVVSEFAKEVGTVTPEAVEEFTRSIEENNAYSDSLKAKISELAHGLLPQFDSSLDGSANSLYGSSEATSALTEKLKELSKNTTKMDSAIGGVVDALNDFGVSSYEVYSAMLALEEAIPGSTDELYDFETGALKVDAALIADKASLLDLIDAQNQVTMNNAITELEKARDAALEMYAGLALAMPMLSGEFGSAAAATAGKYAKMLEEAKAQLSSWNSYVDNLRTRSSYTPHNVSTNSGNYTSRTTSEKSPEEIELERRKNTVKLLKSQLTLLEKSGAEDAARIAKMREIQAALHEEAEYMRSIGADQAEINGLSSDWWDIQKNINELLKDNSDALKEYKDTLSLLESQYDLMDKQGVGDDEKIAKLREIQKALHEQADYLRSIGASQEEINKLSIEWWNIESRIKAIQDNIAKTQQDIFDSVKKAIDEYYDKIVSDKEKELSLEEKILAVKKAEDALAKAQAERNVRYYNAATGSWEWGANQKTVKSAQDSLKSAQDALNKYREQQANGEFKDAWSIIADQIKNGATTFKEAYDYMYQKMTEIQDKYGVDLSGVLETSIGGFKDINKSISDIDKQLIITLMKANSVNWWSADDAGKAYLHAQNENLAKIINATYDANGYWIDENGYRIYDPKDGNPDLGNGASSGGSSGSSTSSTGSSSGSGSSTGGSSSAGNTSPSNGFYWNGGKLYDSRTSSEASQLVYDEVYAIAKRNNVDLGVAASMFAANVYQGAKYDQGGVLRGIGGIKATMNDEMVLPPDITRAILSPISNDLVRGRLEMMRECLDLGSHTAGAFSGHSIGTQNNGDTYNMNGYTISEQQAKSMTVYDFARLAKGLGISNNRS